MTSVLRALCVGLFVGLLWLPSIGTASACTPDNVSGVKGGSECLVIQTYGQPAESGSTLIVFIHGDGSRGGPSDYLYPRAQRYGGPGVVAVGLIRPGYFDSNDRASTGESYRRKGDGYRPAVVDAVAGAIQNLKTHYNANRVILVGHSGGAAISGVILGKVPGLAQAAVLAACPCHVPNWRIQRRGSNSWTRSLSPHSFVNAIPAGTRVVAITGDVDDNTKPNIAQSYVKQLTDRGLDARFVLANDAGHNRVTRVNGFFQAIDSVLR